MNSTLRRRHNSQHSHSVHDDYTKFHSVRRFLTPGRLLTLVGIGFILSYYHIIYLRRQASGNVIVGSLETKQLSNPTGSKDFDCAVYWLRIPKTASTTIAQTFIRPLFRRGNFTNIDTGPNTCIAGVGGCAQFWKPNHANRINQQMFEMIKSLAPRFGTRNTTSHQSNYNQRCFPSAENLQINRQTFCHEYDAKTSTLILDPRSLKLPSNKKLGVKPSVIVQADFDAGPKITTHVGLDPSLFGWILPPNPMVFSTFRDPLERIFSSFHYGIQFGGGRPGEVGKCDLPGAGLGKDRGKKWEERVVSARRIATMENNSVPYNNLMRVYLNTCKNANDNAYVQFLDPNTNDVRVAIQNLEEYVIVGLQNELEETLARWVNISRRSCKSHPRFDMMQEVFANVTQGVSSGLSIPKFRESKNIMLGRSRRKLSASNEENIHDLVEDNSTEYFANLISPDFNNLDKDLKQTITRFTAGDQQVYRRVLELFEFQRKWGR